MKRILLAILLLLLPSSIAWASHGGWHFIFGHDPMTDEATASGFLESTNRGAMLALGCGHDPLSMNLVFRDGNFPPHGQTVTGKIRWNKEPAQPLGRSIPQNDTHSVVRLFDFPLQRMKMGRGQRQVLTIQVAVFGDTPVVTYTWKLKRTRNLVRVLKTCPWPNED